MLLVTWILKGERVMLLITRTLGASKSIGVETEREGVDSPLDL